MWKQIIKLIIDKFISFFGYELIKVEDNKYQQLIRLYYLKKTKNFFFVQLGANDGKGADPLHDFIIDYQPNGILVEPQTDVFNDLKYEPLILTKTKPLSLWIHSSIYDC